MRYGRTAIQLAFDFQRDVDELVFLATDELALTGPVQQRRRRHAVALGLADRMLEEAGVDPGIPHDQRVAVEQTFGRHGRAHHVLGGVGNVEEINAGLDADLVEHPDQRLDRRVTRPGAETPAGPVDLLGAPVILVVDARGQSHSVAALLHGFSTFDTATRIAGVILNRVGSARHEQVLRQACDQAGVAVLGAIPRTAELELPTRYLGLVTAVEYGRRARLAVQAMTAVVARHVDLAAVIACAGSQAANPPWDQVIAVGNTARQPATVAIAAGRAFTFGYAEHAEMLRAAGAEVVEFDPLSETLPEGTDAVVLPGGFPEQFTAELSANDTVRRQINELAAAGAPVHAECAGLLYLVSELDGHPMCGVVAGSARFTQHLKLGYRDAVAVVDSALYSVGERVVGHEFHRTAVTFADSYQPAWVYQGQDVDDVRDGAVHSGVHASYLHTHPAATPGAVARFVAHAACNTPRA